MGKGRLAGTPLIVDNFRRLPPNHGVQYIFFLTHAHADHTEGLTPSWDAGPIYASPVTAALLLRKFKLRRGVVHALETDVPHVLPLTASGALTATVTLMDANHCPGAVMLLLTGYWGTYLHTGDFRFRPEMLAHPALCAALGRTPRVPRQLAAEVAEARRSATLSSAGGGDSSLEEGAAAGGGAEAEDGADLALAADATYGSDEEEVVGEGGSGADSDDAAAAHAGGGSDGDGRGSPARARRRELPSWVASPPSASRAAGLPAAAAASAEGAEAAAWEALFHAQDRGGMAAVAAGSAAAADSGHDADRGGDGEDAGPPSPPASPPPPPSHAPTPGSGCGVDRLYLDNTFGHPRFDFGGHAAGVAAAAAVVAAHPTHVVLVGVDTLGKEGFLVHLARAIGELVWLPAERRAPMELSRDPELLAALHPDAGLFTTDKSAARVRVMSRHVLKPAVLARWNADAAEARRGWLARNLPPQRAPPQQGDGGDGGDGASAPPATATVPMARWEWLACAPVVAVVPSGWACTRPRWDGAHTFAVPYSLHSSFHEMLSFTAAVRPRAVVPTSDTAPASVARLAVMVASYLDGSPPNPAGAASRAANGAPPPRGGLPAALLQGGAESLAHWRAVLSASQLVTGAPQQRAAATLAIGATTHMIGRTLSRAVSWSGGGGGVGSSAGALVRAASAAAAGGGGGGGGDAADDDGDEPGAIRAITDATTAAAAAAGTAATYAAPPVLAPPDEAARFGASAADWRVPAGLRGASIVMPSAAQLPRAAVAAAPPADSDAPAPPPSNSLPAKRPLLVSMHDVLQSLVPGSARYGGHMLARPAPKRQREEPAGGALPSGLGAAAFGGGEPASRVVMLPSALGRGDDPAAPAESGVASVEVAPSTAPVAPPAARGPASAGTIVAADSDEEAAGEGKRGAGGDAASVAATGSGRGGGGVPAPTAPARPAHEQYFAAAAAAAALRLQPGGGAAIAAAAAWPLMTGGTSVRRRAPWRASDALSLIGGSHEDE